MITALVPINMATSSYDKSYNKMFYEEGDAGMRFKVAEKKLMDRKPSYSAGHLTRRARNDTTLKPARLLVETRLR